MYEKAIGAVCGAIMFSSCATSSRDVHEDLKVFSTPVAADVTLSTGETGLTPASFAKTRGGNLQVTVSKPGYIAQTVNVQSKDTGTGAALHPNPVLIQLAPLPTDPRLRGRKAPPGGYPLGIPSDEPGIVRSPYTHRRYDVRAVRHGELVYDLDIDDLFRNP